VSLAAVLDLEKVRHEPIADNLTAMTLAMQ
jgi:hypothetical protein